MVSFSSLYPVLWEAYLYIEAMLTCVGCTGLVYGGAAGVIRSPHPVIHSISCGIHWFACGTTFWCEYLFHICYLNSY